MRFWVPFVLLITATTACRTVSEFQPNVPQGGRAVAIAVQPGNDLNMLVASETGGVFRSTNGGLNWTHISALRNYLVADVAYAPSNANIVIAAAQSDYRVANNGGIWRSTNGGTSWSHPPGSQAASGPRCRERASAFSVSFAPDSSTVYVATDCGVAISSDLGATWSHAVPGPTTPINSERTQNRGWSVLALSSGRTLLAADDGLWRSTNSGANWTRAASGPGSGQGGILHAFAASPLNDNHVFHAGGGQQLFLSTDAGQNWNTVPAPSSWNRGVFVRAARSISGNANEIDVYFGDGTNMQRQTFTQTSSGLAGSGSWTALTVDHADPADIAFDGSRTNPILLATDGGVHRTLDRGSTWTLSGGGIAGFNALQITEVTGQSITGSAPHQDLYYATQDNNNAASSDGGVTWPTQMCCEGFYIRVAPTASDHSNTKVSGVTCAGCFNFLTDAHFANLAGFSNAPDGDTVADDPEGNPILISPGAYIQNTINNAVVPLVNTFKSTTNTGNTWAPAFTIPEAVLDPPSVAGSPTNPTAYVAVRRPGNTPDGTPRMGLARARNFLGSGPGIVDNANGTGFGSLGIFATMFAWYEVYGVNPRDPDHLIYPDIETDEMKVSRDGGQTWLVDQPLTDLVTSNGTYQFRSGQFPLVHTIGFDPYNRCHILVGTAQNGVIRSPDGGQTWHTVRDSERITNISSFYFPPSGHVVVSTYGRGLWKLNVQRITRLCGIAILPSINQVSPFIIDPATGVRIPLRDFGDPEVCPACQYILIRNGQISDLTMEGDRVESIAMTGGTIHQIDRSKREVPLTVPNSYAPLRGQFAQLPAVQAAQARDKKTVPVRGLVVEGDQLRGVIIADDELPFEPVRIPYVQLITSDMAVGPRVSFGERLTIHGRGFGPGTVRIAIAGKLVADNVPVDSQGFFRYETEIRVFPGDYRVVVEQSEGRRLTQDQVDFKVVPRDKRPGGAQP